MSTLVVVGVVADTVGAGCHTITVPYNGPERNFDVRREYSCMSSTEYRTTQPARIIVDVDHERPIGELKYLEHVGHRLWGVAEIEAAGLGDGPWFFSPSMLHRNGKDIQLDGLAVTRTPASIGLGPITPWPGTLRDIARHIVHQDGFTGQIVKRAAEYDRNRRRDEPITIRDEEQERASRRLDTHYRYLPPPTPNTRQAVPPQLRSGWKPGDLEWSQVGGRIISVR